MRERLNCPNCGAPITDVECPYCGTIFYDFTVIDAKKPTYLKMKLTNGQVVLFNALLTNAVVNYSSDALPEAEFHFVIFSTQSTAKAQYCEVRYSNGVVA